MNETLPTTILLLPGPDRKRSPSPYIFYLRYRNPDFAAVGCRTTWDVLGGRERYQISLEATAAGLLRWHCSCADAIYRGENVEHHCKHIRGLQECMSERNPTPDCDDAKQAG